VAFELALLAAQVIGLADGLDAPSGGGGPEEVKEQIPADDDGTGERAESNEGQPEPTALGAHTSGPFLYFNYPARLPPGPPLLTLVEFPMRDASIPIMIPRARGIKPSLKPRTIFRGVNIRPSPSVPFADE
jgi:hypothetical protein